jgi:hypothetical protein
MRQRIEKIHEEIPKIAMGPEPAAAMRESMRERIERVSEDLNDLQSFYNIEISDTRKDRLKDYFEEELTDLRKIPFKSYDQQGKIDYLLLQNFLRKGLKQLELDGERDKKMESLLPFAATIVRLCEDRQMMKPVDGEKAAGDVFEVSKQIAATKIKMIEGKIEMSIGRLRSKPPILTEKLRYHLAEWFGFFKGYDPMFTWWVAEPYAAESRESWSSLP